MNCLQPSMRFAIVAAAALLPLGQYGFAAIEWGASVQVGAQYEDNIDRLPVNEESDTERNLGLNLNLNGQGSRYLLDIDYRFLRRDYQDDVLEDDTAINGDSALRFELLRSLDFVLDHQISELRSNLEERDTAENRNNRSVLSTGLDWNLAFSRVDQLRIAPRYVRVDLEDVDDSESTRNNLGISWLRQLSEVSQLTVSGQRQDVTFEQDGFDYELDSVNIGYSTQLSRLSWGVQAGYSDISRDDFEDTDGTTLRLEATYTADTQSFGVVWLSELTDSVIGFSSEDLDFDNFDNNDNNFDVIDIIERDEFQAFYNKQFNASNDLSVRLSMVQEDYEIELRDQQRATLTVRYGYRISPRLRLVPSVQLSRFTFEEPLPEEENDELRAMVELNYELSRSLTLNFGVGYEERDSDTTPADEYENTIGFINAVYTFR